MKTEQDMLRKGRIILAVFLILTCYSCKKNMILEKDSFKIYVKQAFSNYSHIHENITDSLNKWVGDSILLSKQFAFDDWRVDSAIVFNSDSSRFFCALVIFSDNSLIDDISVSSSKPPTLFLIIAFLP